jgi:hypothetical protein
MKRSNKELLIVLINEHHVILSQKTMNLILSGIKLLSNDKYSIKKTRRPRTIATSSRVSSKITVRTRRKKS